MLARLTVTTALTTLWAASLLARAHGFMAGMGTAGAGIGITTVGANGDSIAAGIMMAGVAGSSMGTADFAASFMVEIEASAVVTEPSTAEAASMVEVVSTEAVDFTVAGAGNSTFQNNQHGWQNQLPAVFISWDSIERRNPPVVMYEA